MPAIPCTMIRGGTSRGAYFRHADLPENPAARDVVVLRAMGGPDALQIDGIGGGHPLTSKVAIVAPGTTADVDVDYLFLQVDPSRQTVSDAQNCGNILAGVALFAIAEGLVDIVAETTTVRVKMSNTGAICHLTVATPDGAVATDGDTSIDGVPGTASPIVCDYLDIAGSSCDALLPTGRIVDRFDDIDVTCVDNGMPVVAMRSVDLGISGTEAPATLDANDALKARLESVRRQAGPAMGLGDVREKSVPKMCLVSPPQSGGAFMTRTFIPHTCHKTIGVLGAVSAATACALPDAPVASYAELPDGNPKTLDVEHPAGALRLVLGFDADGTVARAGVVRTARTIFKGEIYV